MKNRHSILIIYVISIWIYGCSANDYGKDFQLTTINEPDGMTGTELSGMGGLPPASGDSTDDYLVIRKNAFNNLTVDYRLTYQRPSSVPTFYPKRILFVIDGQRTVLTFLGSNRSNIYEWAWVSVQPSFLEKIANAKEVRLTVEGSDRSIDYIFNDKYLYFYNRFYKECVNLKK